MKLNARWRGGKTVYSVILRRTWTAQGMLIGLGLALPVLAVLPLELQRRMIDLAIPARDMTLLLWLAALYLGLSVARGAIKFVVIWLRGLIAEVVARVLRVALVRARRHQGEARATASLGAAASVMTGEVEPIGAFAAEALNTPVIQGGTLVGVFGYMLGTEPVLAVVGIAALVLEAVITPVMQHWINLLTYRRIRALRIAGHGLIAASREGARRSLIQSLRQVRRTYLLRLRMNLLKASLKTIRNLIENLAEVAVLAIGAAMVMRGETELGVVVAFLSGLRRVREPWSELLSFYRRLADARIKYRLIRAQIQPPAPEAVPGTAGAGLREGAS